MDETREAMRVDGALVEQLAALLNAHGLSEIEVQDGDRAIRVARSLVAAAPAPQLAPAPAALQGAPTPEGREAPGEAQWRGHPGLVKAPIVGTAYLTPEPGAAPFVTNGQQVEAGATLLIVEAMKVMNPIVAPKAGRIAAILIESEQPVEYDQPLIVIE